jgi:hypothetical protein
MFGVSILFFSVENVTAIRDAVVNCLSIGDVALMSLEINLAVMRSS